MQTKNLPIMIGIALPIVFVVIISIAVLVPSLFVKPQYNFIYTQENQYDYYNHVYKNTYKIEDGHLMLQSSVNVSEASSTGQDDMDDMPILYMYDVILNTSHQINFDEAKNFTLDTGPSSPDGYAINYKTSHEGLFGLFGSNSNNDGYYITKGNGVKKLDALANTGYSYYNNGSFKLIGWVK